MNVMILLKKNQVIFFSESRAKFISNFRCQERSEHVLVICPSVQKVQAEKRKRNFPTYLIIEKKVNADLGHEKKVKYI